MKTQNRCDYCGVRNLADDEIVAGWYIAGQFVPMAGGRFAECLDCVEDENLADRHQFIREYDARSVDDLVREWKQRRAKYAGEEA